MDPDRRARLELAAERTFAIMERELLLREVHTAATPARNIPSPVNNVPAPPDNQVVAEVAKPAEQPQCLTITWTPHQQVLGGSLNFAHTCMPSSVNAADLVREGAVHAEDSARGRAECNLVRTRVSSIERAAVAREEARKGTPERHSSVRSVRGGRRNEDADKCTLPAQIGQICYDMGTPSPYRHLSKFQEMKAPQMYSMATPESSPCTSTSASSNFHWKKSSRPEGSAWEPVLPGSPERLWIESMRLQESGREALNAKLQRAHADVEEVAFAHSCFEDALRDNMDKDSLNELNTSQ